MLCFSKINATIIEAIRKDLPMNTIVIHVDQNCKEDNILGLVEILTEEFPDDIIRVSTALVVETNIPQAVAIFQAIAAKNGLILSPSKGNKPSGAMCIDCGTSVKKKGNRCHPCANKYYRGKRDHKPEEMHAIIEVEHDVLEPSN
jgi:hypothetical protein